MRFSWDRRKEVYNQSEHQVSFKEAQSVFYDSLAQIYYDVEHSFEEDRYLIIGTSKEGNLLTVVHTAEENSIRIISAWHTTKQERKEYEKGT